MKKWYWVPVVVAAIAALFLSFGQKQTETTSTKMQIVATNYPLWEFTSIIAEPESQVELLIPPGAEPHHWEPTARDIAKLSQAKVVICQGTSFEPWVEKSVGTEAIVYQAVPSSSDPHFWLDPLAAKAQVAKIAATLQRVDPDHAPSYRERAEELSRKLDLLHTEYQNALAKTKLRTFITTHQAFDYLARRYGLTAISLKGISAEGEPRPGDLMKITQLAKDEGVRVIFKEPFENPRLAEVVAQEIGGETRLLHPIGALSAEDQKQGEDYFSLMRANLGELKRALGGGDR